MSDYSSGKVFFKYIVFVVILVMGLLLAFPIKWCWNYAVVSTFGLPALTWGKAWCLYFISTSLIKSNLFCDKD